MIHKLCITEVFQSEIMEEWIQINMKNNFDLMYKMNNLLDKLHIEMYYWDKSPKNNLSILLTLQWGTLHNFFLYIISIFQNQEYSLMDKLRRRLQDNQKLVHMLMLKHHRHNQLYKWNIIQDFLSYMKRMEFYN